MATYCSVWHFSRTTLAILLATACCAEFALGQYTFVQDTDTTGSWDDPMQWSGGPASTYPNGTDTTVLINAPTTTQALAGNNPGYRLSIPTDVTVGHITIDNSVYNNAYRTFFGNNAGHLKFQSTSGPATYTETNGSAAGEPTANTSSMPLSIFSRISSSIRTITRI